LPAVVAALVGAAVAVMSVGVARRLRPAVTSAALLGVAVGLLYAADAALLKAVTDQAVLGLTHLISCWQLYAVIMVGALGLMLTQLAYQAGPLTASLPAISAVDPLASVVIGVLIFDEHLRRGPLTGASLVALVAILAVSIVQLGRRQAEPSLVASNA
jgi:drug/metabolite transporter (DMT)-like permease